MTDELRTISLQQYLHTLVTCGYCAIPLTDEPLLGALRTQLNEMDFGLSIMKNENIELFSQPRFYGRFRRNILLPWKEPRHPIHPMFTTKFKKEECKTLFRIEMPGFEYNYQYPTWRVGDRIPIRHFENDARVVAVTSTPDGLEDGVMVEFKSGVKFYLYDM